MPEEGAGRAVGGVARVAAPILLLLVAAAALVVPAAAAGAQEPPTPVAPAPSTPSTTAATGGPRITSTITAGGAPVEGVEVVVSRDGTEVGRATSDAQGRVAVDVPGPGRYQVRLDRSSLPRGVTVEADAPTTLQPIVQSTGDRPVVFRLAKAGAASADSAPPSTIDRALNLLASGVRFGLVIALAAVGLSLIFGTTGLTNFAHGELLALGAIVAWWLNADNGGLGLPLWIAGLGGIAAAAVFGAWFELGVYRPLRRRGMPIVSQMVVSIGLAFAFRYLFSILFGAGPQQYSQFAAQAPSISLGPVELRPKDVVITLLALVVLVAVGLWLQRSRLGTAIRAVSDNRDLSIASGIDDRRVTLLVWLTAGGMAGLAGVLLGSTETVAFSMGQRVLLVTFAAVVLGGLGTTFGAMVGGLVVGVVSDLSTLWLDADLKVVVALATLVVVLLIRPQGIFGVRVRTA